MYWVGLRIRQTGRRLKPPRQAEARATHACCAIILLMTDWKKTAAALDPPIPEPDIEKLLPVMNALEAAFRPLQKSLRPGDDVWTGPEDVA
jgi:hypothetical protein